MWVRVDVGEQVCVYVYVCYCVYACVLRACTRACLCILRWRAEFVSECLVG